MVLGNNIQDWILQSFTSQRNVALSPNILYKEQQKDQLPFLDSDIKSTVVKQKLAYDA